MHDSNFQETPSFAGILFPGSEEMRSPVFTVKWEGRQEGAGSGDAGEFLARGEKLFSGDGVPQDFAKAAEWFRKAAEQGSARACCYLGGMYSAGLGVSEDYANAAEWFRKAADLGDALGGARLVPEGGGAGASRGRGWRRRHVRPRTGGEAGLRGVR